MALPGNHATLYERSPNVPNRVRENFTPAPEADPFLPILPSGGCGGGNPAHDASQQAQSVVPDHHQREIDEL